MLKSFQRDSLDIERYCVKKDVLQLVPRASVLASKFALQERFMEHISKQLLELEHLNVAQLQGFLPHKH